MLAATDVYPSGAHITSECAAQYKDKCVRLKINLSNSIRLKGSTSVYQTNTSRATPTPEPRLPAHATAGRSSSSTAIRLRTSVLSTTTFAPLALSTFVATGAPATFLRAVPSLGGWKRLRTVSIILPNQKKFSVLRTTLLPR